MRQNKIYKLIFIGAFVLQCPFAFYGNSSVGNNNSYYYFYDDCFKGCNLNFKAGNITIGGLLSKLKDPTLNSSIAGFTSTFSAPTELTALSSTSTTPKPASIFTETNHITEERGLQQIIVNGAFTPQTKDFSTSAKASLKFSRDFIITDSLGGAFFTLEEYIPAYWYTELPYYRRNLSFSLGNQLLFTIFNYINTGFSVFFYETPFGKIESVFRNDNKIEFGNFNFNLALFFNNSENIITVGNSYLEKSFQLSANLQWSGPIRLGLSAFTKLPLASQDKEQDLKFAASSFYDLSLASLILEGNISYKINNENKTCNINYGSWKIENPWKLGMFTATLYLSSRFYYSKMPENKKIIYIPPISSQNHSIGIGFKLPGELFSYTTTCSFSCKNHNFYNKKVNFSVDFTKKINKTIVILKFNGDFCI